LVIVDVDEVLGLFMRGFEHFIAKHGYEMRITRFALFQSIFEPGVEQHLDIAKGRVLFDAYFAGEVEHMELTPGAAQALAAFAEVATVVILTNAPPQGRDPRSRWLIRNGLDFPLVINSGPKGASVAAMVAKTTGPAAFIDDLMSNLDSVAEAAPRVHRFQLVADERLRPHAYSAPDRHARYDDWADLQAAVLEAIRP
jgi:hypothetical protein